MEIELLNKLAENGIVSIILALSLGANGLLFHKLIQCFEKRLEDAKDYKNTTIELLQTIKQTADLTLSGLQILNGKNK